MSNDTNQDREWGMFAEHANKHQDGGLDYPRPFHLSKMREVLQIARLSFGGEFKGHFFWSNAEDGGVRRAMRELLTVYKEYDKEVGLRMEAESRVEELEAKLALMSPCKIELPPVVEPFDWEDSIESKVIEEKLSGHECYDLRVAGKSWVDMGGKNAMFRAKKHAQSNNLEWPIP
jgi:hypothetical protein